MYAQMRQVTQRQHELRASARSQRQAARLRAHRRAYRRAQRAERRLGTALTQLLQARSELAARP